MSSEEMSKAKACLGLSIGFDVAGGAVKGSVDANMCGKSSSSSSSGRNAKSDSTKVIAIGSKPSKDGEG